MLKNILNLEGVQKLSKKNQESVLGGGFPLLQCPYVCNGTTAKQPSGASQYCLLNFPAIIYNASQCTNGEGDDNPDVYA
ncbi:hypothetical protein [Aquimarina sp. MMG016]|uniref:hypothetical protein n=1 Tax=Aquimarina sp. MMG016 TaxID=2822690 RepID=UPI001B39FE5B|nr:hypothetical protein [Aquimarina sp. MMG016]MBQ4822813.1 hypothetical protein [Aquimarina sp. MMG016]